MSQLQIFENIVKENFNIEEIKDNFTPDDISKWDSITHIDLCAKFEEAFNINFEVEEIAEMESISKMKEVLKRHGVDI